MSSMLEQAIIDAESLKDAATKNAETLVLEKYSAQIKGAVETILEQEDPMAEAPEMPVAVAEEVAPMEEEESAMMESIPLAATTEDLDEEVEIPLDRLMEEINNLSETFRFNGDFVGDPELFEHNLVDIAEDVFEEEMAEMIFDPKTGKPVDTKPGTAEIDDTDEDLEEYALQGGPSVGFDEDVYEGLDEDLVEKIAERLNVDLGGNMPTGWGRPPRAVIDLAEEEVLALEQDSEVKEQKAALRAAAAKLEEANGSLSRENKKYKQIVTESTKVINKLKNAVAVLDKKLGESSLRNAKLIYQNKALNSDSMNERQKHKLVEAVSNAESIEEAKVIFETLENTVGSTSRKSQPKSLSEAVQKGSSMSLSSRTESAAGQKANPTFNRWKFLAGIDNQ